MKTKTLLWTTIYFILIATLLNGIYYFTAKDVGWWFIITDVIGIALIISTIIIYRLERKNE